MHCHTHYYTDSNSGLGDDCTTNSDCNPTNSECSNNKCACVKGYTQTSDAKCAQGR